MVRLIVAEKPSQARAIAEAISVSGRGRGDGCIDGGDVVVSWCLGHLVELAPPEDYSESLAKWSLEPLPFLPDDFKTRPSKSTLAQYKILKALMTRKDVGEIVCATDSGREGELIFDLVYRSVGCKKPVRRLWTASLTLEALQEAYQRLRPASDFAGLRAAAHCRAEADWLVGLNATRAQTLVAQRGGGQGVWPIGRVQTPTLALLVTRERTIRGFVAKPFWQIEAQFRSVAGAYSGKWFREVEGKVCTQLDSKEQAATVLLRAQGKRGVVESVVGVEERRRPEQFFDLTSLQREGNKRFGFSAEKTLGFTQALYERGILSYPRTSSRYLTEAEEGKLPAVLASLPRPYAEFAKNVFSRKLGKRFVDAAKVEDHHAILPTGTMGAMSGDEEKIFDLVARRTLGAYFDDEISRKTTIVTKIGEERFRSVGRVVVSPGWTVIEILAADGASKEERDDERKLPGVTNEERVAVDGLKEIEGKTQPPKPYSEADLLGAMETAGKSLPDEAMRDAMKDSGLGTPATRAAIIEGLLAREMAVRKGKNIIPTEKGMTLIGSLSCEALKSPELTGIWESRLEKVRRGELAAHEFMDGVREYTKEIVASIKGTKIENAACPLPTPSVKIPPCPKCKSEMQFKTWNGKFYVKCTAAKNPECKVSYDSDKSGKAKGGSCKKCKAPLKVTKSGSKVCTGCDSWDNNSTTRSEKKK